MSEAISGKKQLPLRGGRFKIPEDPGAKPYIIGSRCGNCGKYFTPPRVVCLNCGKLQMEEVAMKGKGKVYSYTVVWQQLPGALIKVPYAIVIVSLEEGSQIHSVMTEDFDSLEVGQDVEVYFEKIKEDEEGNDLIVDKVRIVK